MIDHDVIFRTSVEEPGAELAPSSGVIPSDLEGTLLRNGPGDFSIGGEPLHFFDGYGMVAGVSFRGGRAYYRARFVESALYRAERTAGKQVQRRGFSNLPNRWKNLGNINLANAVMHDAFAFGGRLFATDEGGYYRLNPKTLETLEEDRWAGRVGPRDKMAPVPHVDRRLNRLLGYKVAQKPLVADVVTFYEFGADGGVLVETPHTLRNSFGFCHELAFTEHWYVLVEMPVKVDLAGVLWGVRTAFDCFERVPGQSPVVHLVPRDPRSGRTARSVAIPGDAVAQFHLGNAFEEGKSVVFDSASYAWPAFAYFGPPALRARGPQPPPVGPVPTYRRTRIDLRSGAVAVTDLADNVELPRINDAFHGVPSRYAYLIGTDASSGVPDPFVWATCVVRVDASDAAKQIWNAGPSSFLSQPAFAARRGSTAEDDGYVLVWVVDGRGDGRSAVVILDAASLAAGPIATIPLSSFITLASHCRFEPEMSLFP